MCAHNIDIFARSKRAFSPIERKSADMGLEVNQCKTVYMSISWGMRHIESLITAGNYSLDVVNKFTSITTKNDIVELVLPTGVTMVSESNSSRDLSREAKLLIDRRFSLPVLLYILLERGRY